MAENNKQFNYSSEFQPTSQRSTPLLVSNTAAIVRWWWTQVLRSTVSAAFAAEGVIRALKSNWVGAAISNFITLANKTAQVICEKKPMRSLYAYIYHTSRLLSSDPRGRLNYERARGCWKNGYVSRNLRCIKKNKQTCRLYLKITDAISLIFSFYPKH